MASLDELRQQLEAIQAEEGQIASANSQDQSAIQGLLARITGRNNEVSALIGEINALQNQLAQFQTGGTTISQLQAQIDARNAEVAALKSENDADLAEVIAAQSRIGERSTRLEELKGAAQAIRMEVQAAIG